MDRKEPEVFENYPLWIVFITNFQALLIYAVGAYLISQFGWLWAVLYVVYVLCLELITYKEGCVCCCYYGKRCAFNRGKIAKLLFKKEDGQKFCQRKVTIFNLLPHVLVTLIPVVIGVVLLFQGFNWLILILTLLPVLNWFVGNQLVYGKLICLHCAQGRICCPANEFFGKKK